MHAALVLAALALAAPARAADEDPDRLRRALRSAFEKGDYEQAASLAEALAARDPSAPTAAYDAACAYARLGRPAQALGWLRTAAARGFHLTATALRDPDLDPIRTDPGFAEIVAAFERNSAAALERAKPAIDAAPLLTRVASRVDRSRPAPLLVALHSAGGRAEAIADVWTGVAGERGVVLVAPQSHVSRGRGFDWGVMDHAEYAILRAVDRARASHRIDPARIVLTGFSQGASMAFFVALRHPGLFTGVIPVAGHHEERLNPLPSRRPDVLPRFFIMCGARDEAAANNRQAAAALGAAGASVELRIYPGVGHGFPANREEELRDALRFALGER